MRMTQNFSDFGWCATFTIFLPTRRTAVMAVLNSRRRVPFRQKVQAKAKLHQWVQIRKNGRK